MFPSLSCLVCLTNLSVSILFICQFQHPLSGSLFVGTAKVVMILILSRIYFSFFSFCLFRFRELVYIFSKHKKRQFLTPLSAFQILLLYPFHCIPSSEAECKCRRKFHRCKTICRNILFNPAKTLKHKANYLHSFSQAFMLLVQ